MWFTDIFDLQLQKVICDLTLKDDSVILKCWVPIIVVIYRWGIRQHVDADLTPTSMFMEKI